MDFFIWIGKLQNWMIQKITPGRCMRAWKLREKVEKAREAVRGETGRQEERALRKWYIT